MSKKTVTSVQNSITDAGTKLFMQHGMRRVSVTEICATAKTSKVTFYKYFDNKISLAKEIIIGVSIQSTGEFQKILEMDTSFYQKVHELILLKLAAVETMSPVFIEDIWSGDFPEIQQFIEQERVNQQQTLHDFFNSGIESKEIRHDLSVEMLQFLLDQMQAMVFDERFCKLEPNLSNRVQQAMEYFFYGIKNHD